MMISISRSFVSFWLGYGDVVVLRELNEEAAVLFRERLHEGENGAHVAAAVRLLLVGRVGVALADEQFDPFHIVDEQARHALEFFESSVQIHRCP